MTDHTTAPNPAVDLLLLIYDVIADDPQHADAVHACGHVAVQPIFTLKNIMDAGAAMRTTACDYDDPDGRFL